jgi:adenine-specific DNA-methyltransferase
MFKTWLGQTVGKDDLTRHDKWLCMMTPRLKLLRELLSDDGAIFISIDDNEQHCLRQLMNEIFGEENFLANVLWQKKYAASNDSTGIAPMHDFILVYQKTESFERNLLSRTEKQDKLYKYDDVDGKGLWRPDNLLVKTFSENSVFPIVNPKTKKIYNPPLGSSWRGSRETIEKWLKEKRIFFGKGGKGAPQLKRYLNEVQQGIVPTTWWTYEDVGHNDAANKELTSIMGEKKQFDTPKPTTLIKRILQIATTKDSLILDSFAGSGTTMHAVMDLNKEDGGSRSCIMVQMTEASKAEPKKNICRDITRERIKRAIDKHQYRDGFRYLKIGIAIDAETMLSGILPTWKQLAEYVYYLCTGTHQKDKKEMDEKRWYTGTSGGTAIYLVYKKDREDLSKMAVTLDNAKPMIAENPGKRIIVYAPACFLEESFMRVNNIEFVGIPYDLFKRTEVR